MICPFCFLADVEHGVPCSRCHTTTAIRKRQTEENVFEDVAVNDPDWQNDEEQARQEFDDNHDDDDESDVDTDKKDFDEDDFEDDLEYVPDGD